MSGRIARVGGKDLVGEKVAFFIREERLKNALTEINQQGGLLAVDHNGRTKFTKVASVDERIEWFDKDGHYITPSRSCRPAPYST